MLGVGAMEETRLSRLSAPAHDSRHGSALGDGAVGRIVLPKPLDMTMSVGVMVVAMLNLLVIWLVESLRWWRTASLAASIGMYTGWNWMQQTLSFGVSGIESGGW